MNSSVFQDQALANPVATQMREIVPGIHRVEGFFPAQIQAIQTTRYGGISNPPYDDLNFGHHVGDDPKAVSENRQRLSRISQTELIWLDQVHGTHVTVHMSGLGDKAECRADAILTDQLGRGCLVMTADCLPLLIARPDHHQVAAVHAGWRGLCDGVIEAALDRLVADGGSRSRNSAESPMDRWWIWLGPAIGPTAFEVGDDVRAAFLSRDAASEIGFMSRPGVPGKWLANLQLLARLRLQAWFNAHRRRSICPASGVEIHVAQQNDCVFTMAERYFSYRRDHVTGRMASLISLI